MVISALYPPVTAFGAFGVGLNATAHNVANVATDGFKAGRVTYGDLPRQSGVAAGGPQKMAVPGAFVPEGGGLPRAANRAAYVPEGFVETSNTDVATEMVNLITLSRGYQANAKTVRTADDMLGTLLDRRA